MSVFEFVTTGEREQLADVLVTAVFMGLVGERLAQRVQVFIGYGAGYDAYNDEGEGHTQARTAKDEDVASHEQLREILQVRFPGSANLLIIGAANKWVDASKGGRDQTPTSEFVITGARSATQVHVPMSLQARQLALDCLNSNQDWYDVNRERGAYYGVADLDMGEVYGPVSTTRQIFRPDSGRWMNPTHGWIFAQNGTVAPVSNAGMVNTGDEQLIGTLDGHVGDGDFVIGYCHGMIFAEHICAIAGGGTAYEISMNKYTCKNASCFGCSTFMFANGMPPSWMHIGRAESWVPLPETPDGLAYAQHFNRALVLQRAREMNARWTAAVARWMKAGIRHTARSPQYALVNAQLAHQPDRTLANWFLDALTIHTDDVVRLLRVMMP